MPKFERYHLIAALSLMLMLLPLLSTQVMGAWGYSKQANSLDKMEAILRRMETEYEATQEPDVRPNTVSYVTVR